MLSALDPSGKSCLAWETDKVDGPFICPECRASVLLRKGEVKVHHFAHIPPTNCQYGTGESEQHRQAKMAIYQGLLTHPDVTRLRMERSLRDVRPDVSCFIRDVAVAIEVQLSRLTMAEVIRRTRSYTSKGIAVLWTPPYTPTLQLPRYTLKQWEKFIHALYFKKLFYWQTGQLLQPVTFTTCMIDVPFSEWYDEYGDLCTAGGYSYPSKRWRTPQFLQKCEITSLHLVERPDWISPFMTLPKAQIWSC